MKKHFISRAVLGVVILAWFLPNPGVLHGANDSQAFPEIRFPYEKFVLDNGLRVIVHEDHKAPIVVVGDAGKIRPGLESLSLATVEIMNPDGELQ